MAQYNLTPDIVAAPSVITNVFAPEQTISHENELEEKELQIENQPTETNVRIEPNVDHKFVQERVEESHFQLERDGWQGEEEVKIPEAAAAVMTGFELPSDSASVKQASEVVEKEESEQSVAREDEVESEETNDVIVDNYG